MSQPNEGAAANPDVDASKAPEQAADTGKQPETGNEPADNAKPADASKGKSLAEVAGVEPETADDKKPQDAGGKKSVLDELIETRKENREMRALLRDEVIPTIKQLQDQVKAGGTGAAAAKDELDELAEEFNLQPEFVKKLANAIGNKSAKSIEDKYLGDIKDIKAEKTQRAEATQAARIAKAVDVEIERVITDNPQFAKIANPAAIKKYVLADQTNLQRSMDDIFEELYGGAVKDNPSVDGYAGGAANNPKAVDFSNLDDEGHKSIAAARATGGKEFEDYQANLLERLNNRGGRSKHAK